MVGRTIAPSLTFGQSIQLYARMARPSQLLAVFLVYTWGFLVGLSRGSGFGAVTFLAGAGELP